MEDETIGKWGVPGFCQASTYFLGGGGVRKLQVKARKASFNHFPHQLMRIQGTSKVQICMFMSHMNKEEGLVSGFVVLLFCCLLS
jgi:hypothetical protein